MKFPERFYSLQEDKKLFLRALDSENKGNLKQAETLYKQVLLRTPLNEEVIIQQPPPKPEHNRAMSKKDLAEYFGVTPRTITNWIDWLPHVRIGNIIRFDLEQVKRVAEKRFGQNKVST